MNAHEDVQAFTESFYHTIQGQLAVNAQIDQLLTDANALAAKYGAEGEGVLESLRALKKANASGQSLLAVLEVAKRNALQAAPNFGPPSNCPNAPQAEKAA